jgi:nicotinamide-nucleotide amidase
MTVARAAIDLVAFCRRNGWLFAVAESCTGGLVAEAITSIPGASEIFDRGFVSYSNAAKEEMLGVPAETLGRHGAVSAETARAMAEGALRASRADIAAAITGIAGPGGGSAKKPVGLVYVATARKGGATAVNEFRYGDIGRGAIRNAAAIAALRQAAGAP